MKRETLDELEKLTRKQVKEAGLGDVANNLIVASGGTVDNNETIRLIVLVRGTLMQTYVSFEESVSINDAPALETLAKVFSHNIKLLLKEKTDKND